MLRMNRETPIRESHDETLVLVDNSRRKRLAIIGAGIVALTQVADGAADAPTGAVLVLNDHEEVGSASTRGASGPLLGQVLERLAVARGGTRTDVLEARLTLERHRVELAQARARYLTTLGITTSIASETP